MRTAEEILKEYMSSDSAYVHYDDCIGAMNDYAKLYANQKLEEAKQAVSLRETNVYSTPDLDSGFSQGIDAATETILSLKEEI